MIREITIPPYFLAKEGLPPQGTLRDLGSTVLLAGANGSGKTRSLRVLTATMTGAGECRSQLAVWERNEPKWRATLDATPPQDREGTGLREVLAKLEAYRGVLVDGTTGLVPLHSARRVIQLTYDLRSPIEDAAAQAQHRIENAVTATATAGFAQAYTNAHAYLTVVARQFFNARHQDFQEHEDMQRQKADADAFNRIVTSLLGVELTWKMQQETGLAQPLVMGRGFNAAELSEGQKILLAWAIILHRQREHLSSAIVVIDEPESHLHPDVCIRALDKLRKEVLGDQGQLWLATHSIPLIAWAGFPAIHVVHHGRIEYAGNRVDEVVNGLVGGPEGRERLRTFLADAEDLALFKFAAECLMAPMVAHSKGGDPQEAMFAKLVVERAKAERPLRVLDFGAGHGRLASALAAARHTTSGGEADIAAIHLFAYDHDKPCESICAHHLAVLAAQPGASADFVEDLRTLRGEKERVDVVVLCNVLHEIPVTDWLKTFGDLQKVLVEDGCLILMEDQTPSVGELANDNGFLIVDAVESKCLFGDDDRVRAVPKSANATWEGRLTMVEVPRAALGKATSATILHTLELVQDRAEKAINKLRGNTGKGSAFQRGRLNALHAILSVNARIAQRVFGGQ